MLGIKTGRQLQLDNTVGWIFDFIPVVWLLRRVTRSAGQTAPPPRFCHI